MTAIKIGRLCVKIAGRDAGRECLIVDKINSNYVLIDGLTRRRKCNIKHLEMLSKIAKIKSKAGHEEIMKALAEFGIKSPKVFAGKKEKAKKLSQKKMEKKSLLGGLIKTEKKPKIKSVAEKTQAKKALVNEPVKDVKQKNAKILARGEKAPAKKK